MKSKSRLIRILQAFLVAGISIFILTPAFARDLIKVTGNNYVRAETELQMKDYIEKMDFVSKLVHLRDAYHVHNQVTVRGNKDTYYSVGVFDLRSPLTVTFPDPEGRYQSLMEAGHFQIRYLLIKKRLH